MNLNSGAASNKRSTTVALWLPCGHLWPPVAMGRECGLRGGTVGSRATQEGESVGLHCSLSPPEEANEEQDTHQALQGGTLLPAESFPNPGLSNTGKLQDTALASDRRH